MSFLVLHIKCQKIENGFDEELTEFWNTLRSVRVSDKFLQLPEGIHFFVQHSILFIANITSI